MYPPPRRRATTHPAVSTLAQARGLSGEEVKSMRPIVTHVAPTWISAALALGISALGCGEPAAPALPSDELAYRSLVDGALYLMRADGTNPARLGTGTFMADRGSWSRDGRSIAASRYPDNQIVLVDAVTGAAGLPLTSGSGGRGPSWSPDGGRITFNVQDGATEAIYVMDATGANIRRLTSSPFLDQYPVWTLDGRLITFHRYQNRSIPGPPLASRHLPRLDGTAAPWPAGDSAHGDLPIWRP